MTVPDRMHKPAGGSSMRNATSIATIAIAATLTPAALAMLAGGLTGDALKASLMGLPLGLSAVGLIASLLGIVSIQALKGMGPAAALRYSAWRDL